MLNLICATLLLVSNITPLINPEIDADFAIFGLTFPYLLIANSLFIFYWLIKRKIWLILPIFMFLLSVPNLNKILAFNFFTQKINKNDIKIMTYNVEIFGLYEWDKNTANRDEILQFLKKESPDIICFQEFFSSDEENYFTTTDTVKPLLNLPYHHEEYTHLIKGVHRFGIATFSKYPIVKQGLLTFENDDNNVAIYSDLVINNDTIRVYNAHLSSIRLEDEDHYVLIGRGNGLIGKIKDFYRVYQRLKLAFEKRATQIDIVLYSIMKSPHPVVFCADINDSPISFAYNETKKYLKDAFIESGFGYGNTYIGKLPSFRIDYIFHDEKIKSKKFVKHPEKLSDHHAISCYLDISGIAEN